jgi:8-oxo-dGTP diphosphatase
MRKAQRRALLNDKPPIAAVGGVVYRRAEDGSVDLLLIRKRGGYWTLPKGKLKPGETDADALLREVAEETGLAGEVLEKVRTVKYTTPRRRPPQRKVVSYYLFRAEDGATRPGDAEGIAEVRWVALPDTLKCIQRRRVRRVVRAAAQMLREER